MCIICDINYNLEVKLKMKNADLRDALHDLEPRVTLKEIGDNMKPKVRQTILSHAWGNFEFADEEKARILKIAVDISKKKASE